MTQTFSQSLTGPSANFRYQQPLEISIGDSDTSGSNSITGNALNSIHAVGAQQGSMMRGSQIMCKGPSGDLAWHIIDAERSIPGVLLVMRKV